MMETSDLADTEGVGDGDGDTPPAIMAKDAAELFKSQRYSECLSLLKSIQKKKGEDVKVLHNIALVEYYNDGCVNPQKLLDVLAKVKNKSDEATLQTEEQPEGALTSSTAGGVQSVASGNSNSGGVAVSGGSSSSPMGTSPTGSALSPLDGATPAIDDFDTFTPSLNKAILLYHMQKYAASMSILENLFRDIEPMEEAAALRVCFLMLDILLASRQTAKATSILAYVEKALGYLTSTGEGAPSPATNRETTSVMEMQAASSATWDVESDLTSVDDGGLDEEVLEALGGTRGGPSILTVPATPTFNSSVSMPAAPPLSPAAITELKRDLHFYKARLLLLTRNLKGTKREVKSALLVARDHLQGLLLKAELETARGNFKKAVRLVTACCGRDSEEAGLNTMLLSNLGCVHGRMGKPHTAALFFAKALRSYEGERKLEESESSKGGRSLSAFSRDKGAAILYNAGLQQLLSPRGDLQLAARCLLEAASVYWNRPTLWLRLAECCIQAQMRGLLDDGEYVGKGVVLAVAGEGKWRHVVLRPGSLHNRSGVVKQGMEIALDEGDTDSATAIRMYDKDGKESLQEAGSLPDTEGTLFVRGAKHKLSMEFGRDCLENALHLLDRRDAAAEAAAVAAAAAAAAAAEAEPSLGAGSSTQLPSTSGSGSGSSSAGLGKSQGDGSGPAPASSSGNEGGGKSGSNGAIAASVASFEAENQKELLAVRCTVLADLAYVQLCLENPVKALRVAELLLHISPGTHDVLAHTYAAEALCALDRTTEAAEHLSILLMEEIHTPMPTSDEGREADGLQGAVTALTGPEARAALYVNLAAAYAMQGEIVQAQQCAVQALSLAPSSPLAMLAVVYVELTFGRKDAALGMLKHCRHVFVEHSAPRDGQTIV